MDRAAIRWGVCVDGLPAGRVIGQPGPGAEHTSRMCLPMFRLPTAVTVSRRRQHNGLTASLARGGDASEARDPTISTLRRRPESHVRSVIQKASRTNPGSATQDTGTAQTNSEG